MDDAPKESLFVYGTLRQASQSLMYKLLARYATFYANAWFNGQLYVVSYYPCAIESNNPADKVYGELYELHDAKTVLAKLDVYEVCSATCPEPHEYTRVKKTMNTNAGDAIEAWIYIYNFPVGELEQIQSGDFFDHISH